MGVYSDGSYDQPAGLMYSYPCTCNDGKWSIVQVGGYNFDGVDWCKALCHSAYVGGIQLLLSATSVPCLPQGSDGMLTV